MSFQLSTPVTCDKEEIGMSQVPWITIVRRWSYITRCRLIQVFGPREQQQDTGFLFFLFFHTGFSLAHRYLSAESDSHNDLESSEMHKGSPEEPWVPCFVSLHSGRGPECIGGHEESVQISKACQSLVIIHATLPTVNRSTVERNYKPARLIYSTMETVVFSKPTLLRIRSTAFQARHA
ncbi:hypothetical protein LX36DRAFT_95447 [Colletotrichum falcatum]|nr:hypothetical protein LX36DRAFT_95447 [Colletotrichum falcatum]